MFERILTGFDGSVHSRRAVEVAGEIAGRFQSTLTIAMVRPPGPGGELDRLEALVPVTHDGRTLDSVFEETRRSALRRGAKAVEPVTLRGEVLESLLEYLQRNPQDLVVVGSRGLTPGRRLLLGSVSSGLVNSAHCPVLVVRPGPPPLPAPAEKPTSSSSRSIPGEI